MTVRRLVTSSRFDPGRPNLASLQKDVTAAGQAALTILRRRIAMAAQEPHSATLSTKSEGAAGKAQASLDHLMAQSVSPVFLAALPIGSTAEPTREAALPAEVAGAAFLDAGLRPVVLLATRLDLRTMTQLSPALVLMALAQKSSKDVHLDAGSLFQAMSTVVAPGSPFPDWEIVQGVVDGKRLHGFGLLLSCVRPAWQ